MYTLNVGGVTTWLCLLCWVLAVIRGDGVWALVFAAGFALSHHMFDLWVFKRAEDGDGPPAQFG